MATPVTLVSDQPANPQAAPLPIGTAANPLITQGVAGGASSATKLEDVPSADGDAGSASLWVRRDTLTSWTSADGDYENPAVDRYGNVKDSLTPTDQANAAVASVVTAVVAGSLVVKGSAGNLYGYNIVTGASAGYLMIFDATSAPADGTVTPKITIPIAANTGIDAMFNYPRRFATGIVMVFSTTGPFSKTISATAFLGGSAV